MATRVTSPITSSYVRTSYVPMTMSRTRRTSGGTGTYPTTYRDTYGSSTSTRATGTIASYRDNYTSSLGRNTSYGTTSGRPPLGRVPSYESTANRISSFESKITPSTTSSRYGTTSYVRGVTSPRPLPPGPGPLDEYGNKMTHSDSLSRAPRTRLGPVKATHPAPSSYRTPSPLTRESTFSRDSPRNSPLSRSRRTSSVSDITAAVDRVKLSPLDSTGSLSKSKRFGSHADIASTTHSSSLTADRKEDSLFEGSSTQKSPVSGKYFSTNSSTYNYKSTEHDISSSPSTALPDIHPAKNDRTTSSRENSPVSTPNRRPSVVTARHATNGNSPAHTNRKSPDVSSMQGLVGLKNLGNTCFMNCVLQSLSNTQLLLDYCLNDDFRDDINKSTSSMKGALVTVYAKMMKSLWKRNADTCISPTELKSQVQKYAPRFMGYNQQDAQEFLIYLLEGLHEDLNRVTTKRKCYITDDDGEERISSSEKARETWKKYLERDNSKIVDIFVGQLKSSLKCTTCGYVSNTFDPFWDLSLPIKKQRSYSSSEVSLYDCFELFTQEETLDGDEKPTCARCKTRRRCTKSFSIQRFPKVLIIHLKRFDQHSYSRSKLSTMVDFPLRDLDLSKFAAEKSAAATSYSLYAVANHSGTPFSGHYTAYCKHPVSSEWHYYNDARVTSIQSGRVKSAEAYVLFYHLTNSHHASRL